MDEIKRRTVEEFLETGLVTRLFLKKKDLHIKKVYDIFCSYGLALEIELINFEDFKTIVKDLLECKMDYVFKKDLRAFMLRKI